MKRIKDIDIKKYAKYAKSTFSLYLSEKLEKEQKDSDIIFRMLSLVADSENNIGNIKFFHITDIDELMKFIFNEDASRIILNDAEVYEELYGRSLFGTIAIVFPTLNKIEIIDNGDKLLDLLLELSNLIYLEVVTYPFKDKEIYDVAVIPFLEEDEIKKYGYQNKYYEIWNAIV